MIIRSCLFIAGLLSVIMLGCAVQEKATRHASPGSSAADIDYTLIYLLHGDADYLYHGEEGQPLQADEEVLKEARSVAENAKNGEVFIFHQRPEQKVLWLFPKKDRRMYHYRNGEMVNRMTYSPAPGEEGEGERTAAFTSETVLYETYRSPAGSDSSLKRVLLFYGHEIPMQPRTGYHRSRPEAYFGSPGFAGGIARFNTSASSPLDLIILSTCNNGTPDMLHHLKDQADYVLASPQNLHLSHIDSDALSVLERRTSVAPAELAAELADQTLGRMSTYIQTGVTLSLYDTNIVGKYVADLAGRISERTSRKEQITPAASPAADTSAENAKNAAAKAGANTQKRSVEASAENTTMEAGSENTEAPTGTENRMGTGAESEEMGPAEGSGTGTGTENIDCADLLSAQQLRSAGISVWFQPPAFGRQSGRKSHSGWGCVDPKKAP